MDENEYSSRDELDLELDGYGAIELSDSSDDEHPLPRTLPVPGASRRPHTDAPPPAPAERVDEWRQTITGEGGAEEADDEREIDLAALDSSDEEPERDQSDPAVLKSIDQKEMDELRIPVQSLASALGGYEDVAMPEGGVFETYVPGDDCLGCLRDLRKLWRLDDDDPSRRVARVYAEVNLLGNDLIPIVLATVGRSEDSHKVALAAMDLITSMTWPVHVDSEARAAYEHGDNLDLLIHLATLEKAQQEYKTLILRSSEGEDSNFLRTVVHDLLVPALMTPRVHRTDRHTGTISMCMHLVRNLLEVRDPMALANSAPEAVERSRAQSHLVVTLDKSNFLDVLLMLCSTSADDKSYDPWAAIAMECVYHMYIGTSVRAVAGFWHDWGDAVAGEDDNNDDVDARQAERVAKERRAEKQHELAQSLFAEERVKRVHQLQVGARHPRFGTTIAYQDSNGRHRIARNPIALRKTVAQLQSEVEKRDRRRPARRRRAVVEPGGVVTKPPWTPEGVVCVRRWADRFIQQGFTPLTRAMWVAIRGEHAKVGDVDLARLRTIQLGTWFLDYFLTRRSMYADMLATREEAELKAERERQAEQAENLFFTPAPKETTKTADGIAPLEEAWDFSDVFEWTKPWALRLVFVRSAETAEFKSWLEFNVIVNLWTMLFRTMDALSRSAREADRTVGEVAQEQVFYDREMLKQCRAIMSAYKAQSLATLSAIEAFTYIMPKVLERFSHGKEYMYVRARDRAKNKTQEEQDDLADQHRAFKEQAFTFASFQRELATKPIATTAILYLERWPDFTTDFELEIAVHVIHRLAIKCHNPGLFFGNKERDLLAKFSDPEQLAQVEAIAPKASRDLKKLVAYLEHRYNKLTPEEKESYRSGKRAPRPPKPEEAPRELIVRGSRPGAEKLAISAAVVVEQQMLSVLLWLTARLELAVAARGTDDETGEPRQEAHEDYELSYDGDRQVQSWASSVPEVWLLLSLCGLGNQVDEIDSSRPWRWYLPKSAPTDMVQQTVEHLQGAVQHPFRNGDEPVRKLLMRKPLRAGRPGNNYAGDEYVAEMIASESEHESEQSDASVSALQRAMEKRATRTQAKASRGKPRSKASKSTGPNGNGARAKASKQQQQQQQKQQKQRTATSRSPAEESDASIDSDAELAAIDALIVGADAGAGASTGPGRRTTSSSPGGRSPFDAPASDGGSVSSPPPSGPQSKRRSAGLFLGDSDDDDGHNDDDGARADGGDGDGDSDMDLGAAVDGHGVSARSEQHQVEDVEHDARGTLFRASLSPELRAPSADLSPRAAKMRERDEKEAALRAALLAMDDDDDDDDEEAEAGVAGEASEAGARPPAPMDQVMSGLKRTWERHMSLEERPELAEAAYASGVLSPVVREGSPEGPPRPAERKRRPVIMDDEEDE